MLTSNEVLAQIYSILVQNRQPAPSRRGLSLLTWDLLCRARICVNVFRPLKYKWPIISCPRKPAELAFVGSMTDYLLCYLVCEHIMDKVVDSGAFTTLQLQQINRSRLYLDVSTVSNLTTTNGKFIDAAISQGHRTILSSVSRWHKQIKHAPLPKVRSNGSVHVTSGPAVMALCSRP
jgi:hypothetical protein